MRVDVEAKGCKLEGDHGNSCRNGGLCRYLRLDRCYQLLPAVVLLGEGNPGNCSGPHTLGGPEILQQMSDLFIGHQN